MLHFLYFSLFRQVAISLFAFSWVNKKLTSNLLAGRVHLETSLPLLLSPAPLPPVAVATHHCWEVPACFWAGSNARQGIGREASTYFVWEKFQYAAELAQDDHQLLVIYSPLGASA